MNQNVRDELAAKTMNDLLRGPCPEWWHLWSERLSKRDEVILEAGTFAASCFDKENKRVQPIL